MAFVFSTPPDAAETELKKGLQITLSNAAAIPTLFGDIDPHKLRAGRPHRAYRGDAGALTAGRLLETARLLSWRYLLTVGEDTVGAADVGPADGSAPLHVQQVGGRRFAVETDRALAVAARFAGLADADYEPRFLIVPEAYFAALWLHGAKDWLVVLSEHPGLEPGRPYSAADVAARLAGSAPPAKSASRKPGRTRRSRGGCQCDDAESTGPTPALSQANFLGQGFDISGKYSIPDSLIKPLLDPTKVGTQTFEFLNETFLIPLYVSAAEDTTGETVEDCVETREEFQNSISATAGVEGSYGAFSGQMEASYGSTFAESSNYSFAYHSFYSKLAVLSLLPTEAQQALSDVFLQAVANLPDTVDDATLPQFEEFFDDYGAYYTSKVALGASLSYYVAVAKTSDLDTTTIAAQMRAEYKGVFFSAGVSADISTTDEYQAYSSNRTVNISVQGGDPAIVAKLGNVDPANPGTEARDLYNQWADSIAANPAVANFSLTGIWELIPDQTKAAAVRKAFEKIKPILNARMVVRTSSEENVLSAPRVFLDGEIFAPEPPTTPLGYRMLMIDRYDVSRTGVRLDKYYGVVDDGTYAPYEEIYARMAADIEEGGFANNGIVLVLASYGWSTNAPPTYEILPYLESAGGGAKLKQFVDWADPGSSLQLNTGSYILVGAFGLGTGAAAELLAYDYGATQEVSQDVDFYRQRGDEAYTFSQGETSIGGAPRAKKNLRRAFRVTGKSQGILDSPRRPAKPGA